MAAMRRGDLAGAWQVSDAVQAERDPGQRDDPRLPYHLRWVWDGRAFDGKQVLVRCYHGLGDTIQFSRYLAPLRARVASLVVEAPPGLVGWVKGLPGPDCVISFDPAHPLPPAEVDFEIMELGHALRLLPERVGQSLHPGLDLLRGSSPEGKGAESPLVLEEGGVRVLSGETIGLCWRAGDWAPDRSVPLRPLLEALPARTFVSLQRGPAAPDATEAAGFCNPGDDNTDVLRTAALIGQCRLVVTVDTMVAHLAGTVGAPTLLLLQHEPDWRWESGEGFSRWYPTVRMVSQRVPGDWSAPLAAIKRLAAG